MYIKDYSKFINKFFLNSSQYSEIQRIFEKYGLTTFINDWLKIDSKSYYVTETHIIAINTDIVERLDIFNLEDEQALYKLANSFAKELFKLLINELDGFTKINDNVYMEVSANYGIITLTSGDDGDYIYLMFTEF